MSSYASFILPFALFTSLLCKSTIVLLFEEGALEWDKDIGRVRPPTACNDRTTKHSVKKRVEGGGGVIWVAWDIGARNAGEAFRRAGIWSTSGNHQSVCKQTDEMQISKWHTRKVITGLCLAPHGISFVADPFIGWFHPCRRHTTPSPHRTSAHHPDTPNIKAPIPKIIIWELVSVQDHQPNPESRLVASDVEEQIFVPQRVAPVENDAYVGDPLPKWNDNE